MSHWELSTKWFDILKTLTSFASQCWSLPKEYHRMLLWPRLRTTLVYEEKHEYSDSSLIICLFRNISMVDVYTGSLISLDLDSWPDLQYQEYSPSCGASLWSCDKEVVYPSNIHTTLLPDGPVCLAVQCYSTQNKAGWGHWSLFSLNGLHRTFWWFWN